MIIKYTAIALASGLGLLCPTPTEPTLSNNTPKPACEADVTLLDSFDAETDCDVSPPQTIAIRLDDASDSNMMRCDDAGGQVLLDPKSRAIYCINTDY